MTRLTARTRSITLFIAWRAATCPLTTQLPTLRGESDVDPDGALTVSYRRHHLTLLWQRSSRKEVNQLTDAKQSSVLD